MGSEPSKFVGDRVKRLPAQKAGESCIYRSPFLKDDKLVERYDEKIATLYDSLKRTAEKYADKQCFGWREGEGPYNWVAYKTAYERVRNVASGLVYLGAKPQKDNIGIYSINRQEWIIAEHASYAQSICVVPLYDTLGADACAYIVNQAELSIVFTSADKIKMLLDSSHTMKCLTTIVQFEPIKDDIKTLAASKNVKVISFEEVEKAGIANPLAPVPPTPETYCTICYTSGTTGAPKGVILTHRNVMADMSAAFINGILPTCDDVHISYLPLAHVFERMVANAILFHGGSMGFYRGDVRKLFDDIQILRPTIFPSVPRLWNRLYDKVYSGVNEKGGISKELFEKAFEAKKEGLAEGYISHAVWDRLVFGNVKEKLGGRIRLMVTGSAPISDKVMEFLRISFGCPVIEGYGQTESCAAVTTTLGSDTDCGHVGIPLACAEIKLVDVPEMNYFTKDDQPKGEVCFRGPCCTPGYYKDKEKTAELIDADGWLHSGDIGTVLANGNLKIIDRKKNIFKLSQGEYIAPEKLENIFVQSKWVLQNFVYGDSLKSTIVAIVVPDPDVLKEYATSNNLEYDLEKLCQDAKLMKLIQDDMVAVGKANQLRGFEFPSKISLVHEQFSVDNDVLTPTFKIKRPQAKTRYNSQLNKMYEGAD